ncbi:MAG: TIR domain-containing protein [Planctomycetota bacterium]|jgi:hypothetical protein
MSTPQKRFKIALSFPGEHRAFVEQVARCLADQIGRDRVLYDRYYEAEFARFDLDTYLQRLYHDQSELIAVFLCADYERKEWCGLEWRAILDLIKKRQISAVMLLRFDNTEIPGLFSTAGSAWIGDRQPEEVADLILERMRVNAGSSGATPTLRASGAGPLLAPARLRHGADHLFGREKELGELDKAWNDPATTSLVFEWMARQSAAGWLGFERVFDWSFYSQGTREEGAPSADAFVAKALEFFGDEEMAQSAASPWDKGARLAGLVAERRTLLVLDGLEPLQYPPGPLAGKLKDPALEALLRGLAQQNRGLCLVTTREHVTDLAPFHDTTVPEWKLEHLSEEAGAALLHRAGARRAGAAEIKEDDLELRAASREVDGHALTLRLLGGYLALAEEGDIRKRASVRFEKADREYRTSATDADKSYGHAFKVMTAYEEWLGAGGEDGMRQLAVLRLMGLFDRPADGGCLTALREAPPITGLTDPLIELGDADWHIALRRLTDCGLISVQSGQSTIGNRQSTIDAHPLLREYFAEQLREQNPEAWRSAHGRLYEHLKDSTEHRPDTLEGLQPLYQAVAHGCQAGLQQQACDEVYYARILRGDEFYSPRKLGAFGADLGAVACFFEKAWSRASPTLSESDQAWLLHEAACRLRALGRPTEALEPMRTCVKSGIEQENARVAASRANNLSELEVTLGDLPGAVRDAEQCVGLADQTGDAFLRMGARTTLGDPLYQAARRAEALARFRQAEAIQAEREPEHPLLYSVWGFRYCDLLLGEAERAAWQLVLNPKSEIRNPKSEEACREVEQRATKALKWAEQAAQDILSAALDHLTLGRAALYRTVLTDSKSKQAEALQTARQQLTAAADGLRRSGNQDDIPRGLLSRAWLRFLEGDGDGARDDLEEAWQIAERGPMRLFMADIHLHRARLFRDRDSLAQAAALIKDLGYGRRNEELADAERAAEAW